IRGEGSDPVAPLPRRQGQHDIRLIRRAQIEEKLVPQVRWELLETPGPLGAAKTRPRLGHVEVGELLLLSQPDLGPRGARRARRAIASAPAPAAPPRARSASRSPRARRTRAPGTRSARRRGGYGRGRE